MIKKIVSSDFFIFHRKILNDLSSECPSIKIEEESSSNQSQDGQETSEAASNLTTTNSIQYQPTAGEFFIIISSRFCKKIKNQCIVNSLQMQDSCLVCLEWSGFKIY